MNIFTTMMAAEWHAAKPATPQPERTPMTDEDIRFDCFGLATTLGAAADEIAAAEKILAFVTERGDPDIRLRCVQHSFNHGFHIDDVLKKARKVYAFICPAPQAG